MSDLKNQKNNSMKLILDEYNRVVKIFENLEGPEDHRNRIYKLDREWWVLGRLKIIFNKESLGHEFPDYADKLSENDTDFVISFDGEKKYKKIQITEVPPLEIINKNIKKKLDNWSAYKMIVNKKLKSDFGKNNWLIIYFDLLYSHISSSGYWHNTILNISGSIDLANNKYERIIIIDSRGDAAVSIFPFLFVIRPEWRSKSTIIDHILLRRKENDLEFLSFNK